MHRFSLGTVLADFGEALKARWPLFLALAWIVAGIDAVATRRLAASGQDISALFGPQTVMGLAALAIWAVAAGLTIHLSLSTGSPWRDAVRAAFTATTRALPALLTITLVLAAPRGAYVLIAKIVMLSSDPTAVSIQAIAVGSLIVGGLEAILGGYLLAARAAAVQEGLGPLAAIRRGLILTTDRRWTAVGLYLLSVLGVGLTLAGVTYLGAVGIMVADTASELLLTGLLHTTRVLAFVFAAMCYLEFRRLVDEPAVETAEVFD